MPGGGKALLYILSFFIPFVGIVLGIIWMKDQDLEKRPIGKNCLIIGIISILIFYICWFTLSILSIIPAVMFGTIK